MTIYHHFYYDVHCPNCGEFPSDKNTSKGCPRCGSKQAVSMGHRSDQDNRFAEEREKHYSVDAYTGKRLY